MSREDRVFVSDGRRHFRRTYSRTEFRAGLGVLLGLALILAWVGWKGAHPDPALFGEGVMPAGGSAGEGAVPGPAADRGVLPDGLALPGWTEGPVSRFDPGNLYEKINGREGYYKALGFRELTFVSLVHDADPSRAVDIELFDQGEAGNALGAYAGERPSGVDTEIGDAGLGHLTRTAALFTRGRYYARAIGSDETPETRAMLEHLMDVLAAGLPGEPLPYGFAFFVGVLGLDSGRISFMPENAFSFGFARDVYAGLLDDETELWITRTADADAAAALAGEFTEGFLSYGREKTVSEGVRWIEDRYIQTLSAAVPVGAWVCGVRGAPDLAAAETRLNRLRDALSGFQAPEEPARAPGTSTDDASPVEEH